MTIMLKCSHIAPCFSQVVLQCALGLAQGEGTVERH